MRLLSQSDSRTSNINPEFGPLENAAGQRVNLAGHVSVLFSYDEDLSPGSRIRYGKELGGRGNDFGQLQDGTDILCLYPQNILVTDLVNSRLQIYNEDGDPVTSFLADEIVEPWASAITVHGQLAVTSRKTKNVVLIDKDGRVKGSFGNGQLLCPGGIAVNKEGYIFVTDFQASKVFIFNSNGVFVRELSGKGVTFNQPRYVIVSKQGDILVSDSGNHQIKIFDKNWDFVRCIGRYGKGDGCLKYPHAMCTDFFGNILVCDKYNDRVSVFTRKGEFVRHLVTQAHGLRHPQGIALSSTLQLYISHGDLKASNVMVLNLCCEQMETDVNKNT